MRITGTNEYNNYSDYNIDKISRSESTKDSVSVKKSELASAQVKNDSDLSKIDDTNKNQLVVQVSDSKGEDVKKAPVKSNPNDFVFDFKKNNNYNLVAAKNDKEDIDLDKEMSQMKKDAVLDQYKFFVNPTNLGTDEDGTVRLVNR